MCCQRLRTSTNRSFASNGLLGHLSRGCRCGGSVSKSACVSPCVSSSHVTNSRQAHHLHVSRHGTDKSGKKGHVEQDQDHQDDERHECPMLAKLEVPMRSTKSVPMEIMIEKIEAMKRG